MCSIERDAPGAVSNTRAGSVRSLEAVWQPTSISDSKRRVVELMVEAFPGGACLPRTGAECLASGVEREASRPHGLFVERQDPLAERREALRVHCRADKRKGTDDALQGFRFERRLVLEDASG